MIQSSYSIGEFASLNKITPRMLRHYDKIGLLKPASVLLNGYRSYTSNQIQTVSNILLYQSCGFSLIEIGELLNADEAKLQEAAKDKLSELDSNDKSQQLARERLLTLAKAHPQSIDNHYDISYMQQSSQLLFCSTMPITESAIETSIEKLYEALHVLNVLPSHLLLLLLNWNNTDKYQIAIPVKNSISYEGYHCIPLEAGWYLSTIHYGDYYDIGMAYDRLWGFAKEKKHILNPPFFERYLLDEKNASSPAEYITQMFVQIKP